MKTLPLTNEEVPEVIVDQEVIADPEVITAPEVKKDESGYVGESPDKTPRENYTLAGVVAGLPTPETTRHL